MSTGQDHAATLDFSIVILTFNRPRRCRDVVQQTARAFRGQRAEILIVDNGADRVELPEADAASLPCRILRMPRNMGAGARNAALRTAAGEFSVFLDDDAYIDPGLPPAMLRQFRNDPAIGALALPVHDGRRPEACLLPTVFHGCGCAFRTAALRRIGGYPESFTYYGEEYDVAFRLYQSGYLIAQCAGAGAVLHARETSGRDINRIISLLIRNNIDMWSAYFPYRKLPAAIADTLFRYYLVARQEKALTGFRRGCLSLPQALLRGWRRRRPLSRATFDRATLCGPLEQACASLRRAGHDRLIICGVGKFPSLWRQIIHQNQLHVTGYLDANPCWHGRKILGHPVIVANDVIPDIPPDRVLLVGLDASAANDRWLLQIAKQKLPNPVMRLANPMTDGR